MDKWEEMVAKGEKGPGSDIDKEKAARVIHETRLQEDPKKISPSLGIKGIRIDASGNLDMQSFDEAERKSMPEAGSIEDLVAKNKDIAEFVARSDKQEKPEYSPSESMEPSISSNETLKVEEKTELTYENYLERASISKNRARSIIDSLFSDNGYYAEDYTLGKIKYTLRSCKGEPVSYTFARLNQFKQWDQQNNRYTDEYIFHKSVYRLAILLYSFRGIVFVDAKGTKTPDMIEKTRDYILNLPHNIIYKLFEKATDFESVILIATSDGFEDFF